MKFDESFAELVQPPVSHSHLCLEPHTLHLIHRLKRMKTLLKCECTRERERGGGGRVSVCVCVCERERERERVREGGRESEREREIFTDKVKIKKNTYIP